MDKDVDKITLKFLQTLNEAQARWFVGSKAIEFGVVELKRYMN